jgi:type IX secretion system PorP/SprF family membrane protein
LLWFATYGFAAQAQDVVFSNPYSNPIYLNPAYTGLPEHLRAGINFHNQGVDRISPYTAYSLYADYFFDKYNSGVGFMALGDRMATGSIIKTQIALSYTYRLKINGNTFLRMAMQPAIQFASYRNSLIFSDQIDYEGITTGDNNMGITSKPFFDISLGMVFTHKRLYTGLAVHHLATVDNIKVGGASVSTPPKITFNIGYNYSIMLYQNSVSTSRRGGHPLTFSPNFIIGQQGGSNFYSFGTYVSLLKFSIGAHYKSSAVNSPHFYIISAHYAGEMVGFSYHFEFGKLNRTIKPIPVNAHEISIWLKISTANAHTATVKHRYDEITYDMPDI